MAEVILRVCDVDYDPTEDATEADEGAQRQFTLDGVDYEIDLCEPHKQEMTAAVARFVGAARRTSRARGKG